MLKQLLVALRRVAGLPELVTPSGVDAVFVLRYDKLDVGTLTLHAGVWSFRYSDAFRQQSEVRTLVDFPDPTRTYEREDLWPFFLSRIPSPAQPEVQRAVEQEHLDVRNAVDMLRRFGERTIANPFTLKEAA
jgi:HipA-like protein